MNKRSVLVGSSILALVVAGLVILVLFSPGRLSYTKDNAALYQLQAIESALARYRKDTGSFPSDKDGLEVLLQQQSEGRYFDNNSYLTDPWQNKIVYKADGAEGREDSYRLYSIGPNGMDERGEGDDILLVGESLEAETRSP